MDRIDHSNYEAWLLDRLDGHLTPAQERLLQAFLAAHPELDPGPGDPPTLNDHFDRLAEADKEALKRTLPPTGLPAEPLDDFLIARLEGDLSPEQREALRVYLLLHPGHARTERLYALTKPVPEALPFAEHRALLRDLPPTGMPTKDLLDDFLVARLEGDLDAAQQAATDRLIATDPQAATAWELYRYTKVPPAAVPFADKHALKRGATVIPIGTVRTGSAWGPWLRAAAAIALLFTVGLWLLRDGTGPADGLATVGEGDSSNTTIRPQPEAPSTAGPHAAGTMPATEAHTHGTVSTERSARPHTPRPSTPPAARNKATHARQSPVERAPAQRAEPPRLAASRSVMPYTAVPSAQPRRASVHPTILPAAGTEALAMEDRPAGVPLLGYLSGKLRKRVLDTPVEDARPLGADDALAAVDKGLRNLVGEQAGLAVDRAPDGRVQRFYLRLGRNLAISANR
jgi:anti-sigma factor RsiW